MRQNGMVAKARVYGRHIFIYIYNIIKKLIKHNIINGGCKTRPICLGGTTLPEKRNGFSTTLRRGAIEVASVLQDVVHLQITSLWRSRSPKEVTRNPIRYSQKHTQHGVPISEEIHYSNEVNGVHTAALCTRTYEHQNRSELERPWSLTVGRLRIEFPHSFGSVD